MTETQLTLARRAAIEKAADTVLRLSPKPDSTGRRFFALVEASREFGVKASAIVREIVRRRKRRKVN